MEAPIYIPTKGRSKKCPTLEKLLSESNTNIIVVVEKEDLLNYQEAFPDQINFLVLEKSNQGIAYARQSILEHARAKEVDWFWMLDDDITAMGSVEKGKLIKGTMTETMSSALKAFDAGKARVGIGALEYGQFAWAQKKPYAVNGYCDVAVCINVKNTKWINYRDIPLKEDRDFALQCLSDGFMTVRTSTLYFQAPANGSNEGGLHDEYASGREKEGTRQMIELWPGICKKHTKTDRNDVKINWRFFKLGDDFEPEA